MLLITNPRGSRKAQVLARVLVPVANEAEDINEEVDDVQVELDRPDHVVIRRHAVCDLWICDRGIRDLRSANMRSAICDCAICYVRICDLRCANMRSA